MSARTLTARSSTFACIAALAATGMALASTATLAQNRQQGPPGGTGSGSGQQQQMQQQQRQADRAMSQEQTMDHDRLQTRERDRTQAQASQGAAKTAAKGIYGGNLMTAEERNQYREKLGKLQTEQERNEFEARHREQMQLRAKERGVEPEVTAD
jgi:opacity protein-like surface antigen